MEEWVPVEGKLDKKLGRISTNLPMGYENPLKWSFVEYKKSKARNYLN